MKIKAKWFLVIGQSDVGARGDIEVTYHRPVIGTATVVATAEDGTIKTWIVPTAALIVQL